MTERQKWVLKHYARQTWVGPDDHPTDKQEDAERFGTQSGGVRFLSVRAPEFLQNYRCIPLNTMSPRTERER